MPILVECWDFQEDGKNEYIGSIYSVGDILLNYDSDKKVPLYGFGAKPQMNYNPNNQTLHCFPINGNIQNAEVYGINGMMESYKQFLNHVELSGPTLFNPLIQEAMNLITKNCKENNYKNYYILLLLTDGQIQDMNLTVASIVKASKLPLSIIIVGLGDEDFTNMKILDGDQGLVDINGNVAERDLVQFVRFNKYKTNPAALASKVLEELPDQVVDLFTLVDVHPNEVQLVQMNEIQNEKAPPPPLYY
ncbi:hypothetical protein IMG5_201120 [Ichthyophthirius multifiliis]|uniref:Copine C-terminal domain-containing protein n=1 Tax=Ichthyophthirius multifiliis TaxID=5932 RepID=G0R5V0_ICHMU|nr:hypothetical protein IMG5_201120 [Ichthyophthirius multifiliis]EGR27171.1 hypothetical protein IMG5_201120 [Ichthyophthirius multifiliis]|eukprot:XP_004024055.1 hypothetical protein IMG5_201120 [Ichthyophthirius multifiliis]